MSNEQPTRGSTPSFSEADMARARECFRKGQDLAAKKSYDYAIECYLSGLQYWPEAVEEGHQPCRAAALFRGKQKVSFLDSIKFKVGGKDPKQNMLNAEALLSRDPTSIEHMEAMFRNAAKAHFDHATMWVGELYADAAVHEAKSNPARFELMREVYEQMGDRLAESDPELGIKAMERAVEALDRLRVIKPNDMALNMQIRDVAGKVTIMRGRYQTAESFRDSIKDTEAQRELHDRERVVQADARVEELIESARQDYEKNPTNKNAINELVNLLCRREHSAEEKQAIEILTKAYKNSGDYRYKLRADDIRIRYGRRKVRQAVAAGEQAKAQEMNRRLLEMELAIYQDRAKHYPTDMRVRYQLGQRLFKSQRFDEAIPVLQEARSDPKTRTECSLYIGRCFFEKGYFSQAVETFQGTFEGYEAPDDEVGKELQYWLGRSYEADGKTEQALKTYGHLIQLDYNYRKGDVRQRMDVLKAGEKS